MEPKLCSVIKWVALKVTNNTLFFSGLFVLLLQAVTTSRRPLPVNVLPEAY